MIKDTPLAKKATHMLFLKSIALTLVLCLFFQEFSYATPELLKTEIGSWVIDSGQNLKKEEDLSWARKLLPVIPESVASIEDAWQSDSDRVVLLIQDAHTNTSCQLNEAKLFDILFSHSARSNAAGDAEGGLPPRAGTSTAGYRSGRTRGSTPVVFTEAAKGNVNLTFLRDQAPLSKRTAIAKEYLQKGLLHGIEYLDLTSDHDFKVEGVEDPALYHESVEVYRQSVQRRDDFERYLEKIQATVEVLKPKLLNPLLLAFLQKYTESQKEGAQFSDYMDTLFLQADIHRIELKKFSQLLRLKELKSLEANIDFKQASLEQQKAVQSLSPEDRKDLSGQAVSKLSMKDNQKGFFFLLKEKLSAGSKTQDAGSYPELRKYLDYLEKSNAMNPRDLFSEKKSLEDEIFKSLTTNEDESDFLLSIKTLNFYQKLFHLSLTPEEYKDFTGRGSRVEGGRKRRIDGSLESLTGFLNQKLMALQDHYDKALFLKEDFGEMERLCRRFYELTYQRDEKFIKNIEEALVKQETAILITGGYHTPSLKSLLKQRGISYIVLTPQVTHETNTKRYEEILLSQTLPHAQTAFLKSAVSKLTMNPYMAGQMPSPSAREFFGRFGKAGQHEQVSWSLAPARLAKSLSAESVLREAEEHRKLSRENAHGTLGEIRSWDRSRKKGNARRAENQALYVKLKKLVESTDKTVTANQREKALSHLQEIAFVGDHGTLRWLTSLLNDRNEFSPRLRGALARAFFRLNTNHVVAEAGRVIQMKTKNPVRINAALQELMRAYDIRTAHVEMDRAKSSEVQTIDFAEYSLTENRYIIYRAEQRGKDVHIYRMLVENAIPMRQDPNYEEQIHSDARLNLTDIRGNTSERVPMREFLSLWESRRDKKERQAPKRDIFAHTHVTFDVVSEKEGAVRKQFMGHIYEIVGDVALTVTELKGVRNLRLREEVRPSELEGKSVRYPKGYPFRGFDPITIVPVQPHKPSLDHRLLRKLQNLGVAHGAKKFKPEKKLRVSSIGAFLGGNFTRGSIKTYREYLSRGDAVMQDGHLESLELHTLAGNEAGTLESRTLSAKEGVDIANMALGEWFAWQGNRILFVRFDDFEGKTNLLSRLGLLTQVSVARMAGNHRGVFVGSPGLVRTSNHSMVDYNQANPVIRNSFENLIRTTLKTLTEQLVFEIDDEIERLRNLSVVEKSRYLILTDDDQALAYSIYHPSQDNPKEAILDSILVDSRYRNKGHGRELFEKRLKFLKAQGYETLFVARVNPTVEARNFHESLLNRYSSFVFDIKRSSEHDLMSYRIRIKDMSQDFETKIDAARLADTAAARMADDQGAIESGSGSMLKPSKVRMTSLPDISLGEIFTNILWSAGTTFLSVGGWIGINTIPAVLEAGYRPESKKSLSWVKSILRSLTRRLNNSPFFNFFGQGIASYPFFFRNFITPKLVFSSPRSFQEWVDSGKRMVFLMFQDFGRIVKRGVNVGLRQAGIASENLFPGFPRFEKLKNKIDRNTGSGETKLPSAIIRIPGNKPFSHDITPFPSTREYTPLPPPNQEYHLAPARLAQENKPSAARMAEENISEVLSPFLVPELSQVLKYSVLQVSVQILDQYLSNLSFYGSFQESYGSGVFFSQDLEYFYILTAAHVVEPGVSTKSRLRLSFDHDNKIVIPCSETVFYRFDIDEEYPTAIGPDLAVLRLEKRLIPRHLLQRIHVLPIYDEYLTRNDVSFIVGMPKGFDVAQAYQGRLLGYGDYGNYLYTRGFIMPAIWKGFSGGPIVDGFGRIRGLVTEGRRPYYGPNYWTKDDSYILNGSPIGSTWFIPTSSILRILPSEVREYLLPRSLKEEGPMLGDFVLTSWEERFADLSVEWRTPKKEEREVEGARLASQPEPKPSNPRDELVQRIDTFMDILEYLTRERSVTDADMYEVWRQTHTLRMVGSWPKSKKFDENLTPIDTLGRFEKVTRHLSSHKAVIASVQAWARLLNIDREQAFSYNGRLLSLYDLSEKMARDAARLAEEERSMAKSRGSTEEPLSAARMAGSDGARLVDAPVLRFVARVVWAQRLGPTFQGRMAFEDGIVAVSFDAQGRLVVHGLGRPVVIRNYKAIFSKNKKVATVAVSLAESLRILQEAREGTDQFLQDLPEGFFDQKMVVVFDLGVFNRETFEASVENLLLSFVKAQRQDPNFRVLFRGDPWRRTLAMQGVATLSKGRDLFYVRKGDLPSEYQHSRHVFIDSVDRQDTPHLAQLDKKGPTRHPRRRMAVQKLKREEVFPPGVLSAARLAGRVKAFSPEDRGFSRFVGLIESMTGYKIENVSEFIQFSLSRTQANIRLYSVRALMRISQIFQVLRMEKKMLEQSA